jgi:nitroreductase
MKENIAQFRTPTYPVLPLFLHRWSPRSMTGEPLSDEEIFSLFEAARWAPSSYNGQPWRFIFAKRDTPHWNKLFDLMIEFNQGWAKNAALLLVIISRNLFEHNNKPAITHGFDAGAAWMSLALEGAERGYVVHGMQGFDYQKAKTSLNIPEEYTVHAMAAIGKRAPREQLPKELQEREFPSDRKPLREIIMEGSFRN